MVNTGLIGPPKAVPPVLESEFQNTLVHITIMVNAGLIGPPKAVPSVLENEFQNTLVHKTTSRFIMA